MKTAFMLTALVPNQILRGDAQRLVQERHSTGLLILPASTEKSQLLLRVRLGCLLAARQHLSRMGDEQHLQLLTALYSISFMREYTTFRIERMEFVMPLVYSSFILRERSQTVLLRYR